MESVAVTPNLRMLRIGGWQAYLWEDGDSRTLIDTGAPGSRAEIAAIVPGLDRIVLTHCHTDHCGSAAELREWSGAAVAAGAGDAAIIRGQATGPSPVLEDWEFPILARVSAGLPTVAPAVPVDEELHSGEVLPFGGGAEILAVPGHTRGSIVVYLPRHRLLFTGDIVANVGRVMLGTFNQDRSDTVESFRRLAELDVDTACFGHGEPITSSAGKRLREVAAMLRVN
jgi:glyoxylase-like metal-dependent hydrolase (beta-lactamase superfamily II)